MQYYSTHLQHKRASVRRRARGGGAHKQAAIIAELLMLWYGMIRHSVNCKLMVRFPKCALLVKAQMLQEDNVASCLRNGVSVEAVEINSRWLNEMLREYRISDLKPNRKFKVPRWVLLERLEIWWLSVHRIRKFVELQFGYDPKCKNVDQPPFYMNEGGSKCTSTLALQGCPTVPLIEDHGATRERISLNSITDTCAERVRRKLPGFELMFSAEGEKLQAKLEEYVFGKGLSFRVTVVTGPSGSYKEKDICHFLERHLEKWRAGRKWEIFFLDAYAPGLTDNVQRLCWNRGY